VIAWLRASPKWMQIGIVLLAAWVPYFLVINNHPILGTFVLIVLAGLFLIAQPIRFGAIAPELEKPPESDSHENDSLPPPQ